jgi:hypothetical protein
MVGRVTPPSSLFQARRDKTTQQLEQLSKAQDIQQRQAEAPLRNKLLDLQAQQYQQELELAPRREQRLQSQESRQQAAFQSDEKKRKLANFIEAAPIINAEARRIKQLPLEQRSEEIAKVAPALSQIGMDVSGFDPNDNSDASLDRVISQTESVIKKVGKRGELTATEKNFFRLEQLQKEADQGMRTQDSVDAFRNEVGLVTPKQEQEQEAALSRVKAEAKNKEERISNIRAELAENSRNAIRSSFSIREALRASSNATQGIPGAVKVQLGRLFPGIDTSDEAALDSALKDLAIQQLQNFKGPTTDFEFVQVQNVTGRLSDGRSANEARLASLDRAHWFMQEELNQFNEYVGQGGDPDKWKGFDFNKTISTSKGTYPVGDILKSAAAAHITMEEAIRRLNK